MSFVQEITHLKNRPYGDRALKMLQKVVSLVKPIMRKHNWHLPVLAEFFPDQDNLVGEQPPRVRYQLADSERMALQA